MAENAMPECNYEIEYHRLKDELLCDIGKDTDKILAKLEKGDCMDMSAFLAGQAANNNRGYDAATMAALTNQNRGVETAMMMNGGMNGMWNNPLN